MGVTLTTPVTEKETEIGANAYVLWGVSSMQGYRVSMEDRHIAFTQVPGQPNAGFFGVYDGHSGRAAADYCAQHLHQYVMESQAFSERRYKVAFETGLMKTDELFIEGDKDAGTTAVIVFVSDQKEIVCSNTGDSRAVLARNGKAVALSIDQKPSNPTEHDRIVKAGSIVSFDRVEGELAVARAVGDARFKSNSAIPLKDQAVTAFPEVKFDAILDNTQFMVIACDGLWDVMTNDDAVQFVSEQLRFNRDIGKICENLIDHALAEGSKDNITAMVVVFRDFFNSLPTPLPPPAAPAPTSSAAPNKLDALD